MTSLWYAGAENPSHHSALMRNSIDQVAINIGSWTRNYAAKFKGLWNSSCEWLAWTDEMAALDDLLDVIQTIGSSPVYVIGPDEWSSHENWLPFWVGGAQMPIVAPPATGLMVADKVFKDKVLVKRALSSRKDGSVLGVVTGKSTNIERFDIVVNTSWYNPQSFGETHVWDGEKLRRYSATQKGTCRSEHSTDILALGVDATAVLNDDTDALIDLSLRSWQALEASLLARGVVVQLHPSGVGNEPLEGSEGSVAPGVISGRSGSHRGGLSLVPATNRRQGRHVLPTMSTMTDTFTDDDGIEVQGEQRVVSVADSIRTCDNCYLANVCPAFSPGASCGYSIPVEIRTREQLAGVLHATVEIQTQRVLQARFSEEVMGQELSPETGREIDRLFLISEKLRNVTSTNEGFKVLIEGTGPSTGGVGGGVLSKIFGSSTGASVMQATTPADILDAEEVPDDL